jgi:hypothetical protein
MSTRVWDRNPTLIYIKEIILHAVYQLKQDADHLLMNQL